MTSTRLHKTLPSSVVALVAVTTLLAGCGSSDKETITTATSTPPIASATTTSATPTTTPSETKTADSSSTKKPAAKRTSVPTDPEKYAEQYNVDNEVARENVAKNEEAEKLASDLEAAAGKTFTAVNIKNPNVSVHILVTADSPLTESKVADLSKKYDVPATIDRTAPATLQQLEKIERALPWKELFDGFEEVAVSAETGGFIAYVAGSPAASGKQTLKTLLSDEQFETLMTSVPNIDEEDLGRITIEQE